MKRFVRLYSLIILLFSAGCLFNSTCAYSAVIQLSINDVIGPATDDYIQRALQTAHDKQAQLVIIQMDTPGGLDSSMRAIIKNIASSSIPVASYVAPSGSRAASAGTYILYASHIAAMAPGTNLGAATPVNIGGIPSPAPDKSKKDKPINVKPTEDKPHEDKPHEDKQAVEETEVLDNDKALKQKLINDAVAYIRSLAELRGRNAQWAEKAVREAASLTAKEALKLNVIDIVAVDIEDLLKQINGREVVTANNKKLRLKTIDLPVTEILPDWRSRFLSVITNPNVAYILMIIGIYGLILEFYNPGALVPGTIGAISLLLALYAFQLLPVNYAGMALILLGVGLMVAEAFEPSFGMLGIGGLISFVIGSVILIDTEAPGFGIDISIIITFAFSSMLMFIFVVGLALKARTRPVVSGLEELIGGVATVVDDFNITGTVNIHSENWQAITDIPLQKNQRVRVTEINGLTLRVKPIETSIEEDAP